ncbi:MAG: iron-sulfur cluster assembly accessory protein [Dehalococcoidia bacterium]
MTTTTHPNHTVPINTIQVTEKAAAKVRQFAERDGLDQFGLKVAVKGGGCSGLQYVLEMVTGPSDDDKVIKQNGIEVYVPKKAFVFLAGTVLDFSDGLNGKGFQFQNPNAKKTCGCGDSFGV